MSQIGVLKMGWFFTMKFTKNGYDFNQNTIE